MSRRGRAGRRCPGCRMQLGLCLCAELPTLPTRTRVVVLLHQLEARKTTNTGRLVHACLPNSELHLRGHLPESPPAPGAGDDTRRPPPWLASAVRPVLLFPHADAQPLDERWCGDPPLTLIVPDGTWSQASRVRRRMSGLEQIPCVVLPAALQSTYRLRQAPRPGQLSTLEAVAHALGLLEGDEIRDQLLAIHRLVVERTLYSKGRLASHEVWGGVPQALTGKPSGLPEGNLHSPPAPPGRAPDLRRAPGK